MSLNINTLCRQTFQKTKIKENSILILKSIPITIYLTSYTNYQFKANGFR